MLMFYFFFLKFIQYNYNRCKLSFSVNFSIDAIINRKAVHCRWTICSFRNVSYIVFSKTFILLGRKKYRMLGQREIFQGSWLDEATSGDFLNTLFYYRNPSRIRCNPGEDMLRRGGFFWLKKREVLLCIANVQILSLKYNVRATVHGSRSTIYIYTYMCVYVKNNYG